MSGHHSFVGDRETGGEHPIEFTAEWGPENLASWVNPLGRNYLRHPMSGVVSVGGLCEEADLEGFMELRYFTERKIRYVFDFDVDGKPFHFTGAKSNIRLWNLHRTHTTLSGTITDLKRGEVVSEAELYFYWSTLPSMLSSFRFR